MMRVREIACAAMRPGLVVLLALCGCYGTGSLMTVTTPPLAAPDDAGVPDAGAGVLRAAMEEVDLTPQPGPPMYGFSSLGSAQSQGYWLRLHGRIFVLQNGANHVAMVQLDLGAASTLLQRSIVAKLADLPLDPPRLVMSTTHTHGGPGAFFGDKFLNEWVAGKPAFDAQLVEYFATRIADGIRRAYRNLRPAQLRIGEARVPIIAASNRSRPAWVRNFDDGRAVPPLEEEVNRVMTMVRVDAQQPDGGAFAPIGAWTTYAVHGNSMPASFQLLHGDVHGLTARLIAAGLESADAGVRGHFVAATATGAEGDVTPGDDPGMGQGPELTHRVAGAIAITAKQLFFSLGANPDAGVGPELSIVYQEVSMRGAGTSEGRLCPGAFLGGPQIRGSEEGRGLDGFMATLLRADEGTVDPPHGCSATKVRFVGGLQDIAVSPDDMPDVLPYQLVTLGTPERGIAFVTVPGEPTTELGHQVTAKVRRTLGWKGPVQVLGLTNGYATYFTTGPEYLAQNYEGGAQMYGGHQGAFLVEQAGRLAAARKQGQILSLGYDPARVFRPGQQVDVIPRGPACDPTRFAALSVDVARPKTRFRWHGAAKGETCALFPLRVECGGHTLVGANGLAQTDDGDAFEVSQADDVWTADWLVSGTSSAKCQFVLESTPPVRSQEFTLPPEVKR